MSDNRAVLETEFMRICRMRGPAWVESVIRPLQLPSTRVTVRDIPHNALAAAVRLFGCAQQPARGVSVQ